MRGKQDPSFLHIVAFHLAELGDELYHVNFNSVIKTILLVPSDWARCILWKYITLLFKCTAVMVKCITIWTKYITKHFHFYIHVKWKTSVGSSVRVKYLRHLLPYLQYGFLRFIYKDMTHPIKTVNNSETYMRPTRLLLVKLSRVIFAPY